MIPVGEGFAGEAACTGLVVRYLAPFRGVLALEVADAIRICVPEGPHGAFIARSPTRAGEWRDVMVAMPDIYVLPPNRVAELSAQSRAPMLLMELERRFCDGESLRENNSRFRIPEQLVVQDAVIRRTASVLSASFRVGKAPDQAFLASVARDLAKHVALAFGRTNNGATSKGIAPERLSKVLAVIERDLAGPLKLADLAKSAHMSEFHFSRMFRYSTGHSPHMYLTLRRMDRARELLEQSDLSLVEVAQSVGYKTQAHFTSVFHAYCGMTPGAFRRAHGGGDDAATESEPSAAE